MSRDTDLIWRDVDDVLGIPGWSLAVGYTVEIEPGDAPQVWIHAAELNTGDRLIPLGSADLPNSTELESILSEQIEAENEAACASLARDPKDDGDYSFDIANEKRHERAYDEHFAPILDAFAAMHTPKVPR